jgi:hypothetical protein
MAVFLDGFVDHILGDWLGDEDRRRRKVTVDRTPGA